MDLGTATWLAIIGAVLGSGGIVGLILAFPTIRKMRADRKKVDADAEHVEIDGAAVLSKAALEQMVQAQDDARRERGMRIAEEEAHGLTKAELRATRLIVYQYTQRAQEHVGWDYNAEQALAGFGVNLGQAPPLLPPAVSPSELPITPTT